MLEVSKVMAVEPEDFYDLVLESAAWDCGNSTGKKCRPHQVRKGLSWRKNSAAMGQW